MLRLGFIPRLDLSVPWSLFLVYLFCIVPVFLLLHAELAERRARAREPRGCRKLGLDSFSNLADEHDYTQEGMHKVSKNAKSLKKKIKIKALIAYPIKSCAGVELNFADATDTGLVYDRQFCFAEYVETAKSTNDALGQKGQTGRWDFRTLRDGKFSKMALIRPEIWVPDPSSSAYSSKAPSVQSQGVLVINYPRETDSRLTKLAMKLGLCARDESFQVPLYPPNNGKYPSTPMRIFKDIIKAYNYGADIPPSLAIFLGSTKPLSLFRVDTAHHRPVRGNAPKEAEIGFKPMMGFPDEYPLQMQNLASIRNIAEKVNYAIPRFSVRRFRPNIVLEGANAFYEDDWKKMRVVRGPTSRIPPTEMSKASSATEKGVEIFVSCRTIRCRLPNVDPDTGERHQVEPDKTLKETRNIDAGAEKGGCLGMMLVPAARGKRLRFIIFMY